MEAVHCQERNPNLWRFDSIWKDDCPRVLDGFLIQSVSLFLIRLYSEYFSYTENKRLKPETFVCKTSSHIRPHSTIPKSEWTSGQTSQFMMSLHILVSSLIMNRNQTGNNEKIGIIHLNRISQKNKKKHRWESAYSSRKVALLEKAGRRKRKIMSAFQHLHLDDRMGYWILVWI